MTRRTIHLFTDQGINHPNQDIAGYYGNVFWVMDGATPLFGDDLLGGDDVRKTMQFLNEEMMKSYDPYQSFEENLKRCCQKADSLYRCRISGYDDIPVYKLPTFAIAAAAVNGSELAYYVLGDCEIRYGRDGWIHDESFHHVNVQNEKDKREVKNRYAQSNTEGEFRTILLQRYRKQRSLLNTKEPGGYWIGSLDAKGLPYGKKGTVHISEETSVYVYCDGFAHLIEKHPHLLEAADLPSSIRLVRHCTEDDVTVCWSTI